MAVKLARIIRTEFPQRKGGVSRPYGFGTMWITPSEHFQAAVVTPKKIFPTSVMRHRAKRRVLAALRSLPLPKPPNVMLIVYPNQKTLTAPFAELKTNFAAV